MWKSMKYTKNEDGNVAMMFAIVLSMLLMMVGVGVDYSNATRLQNKLQSQVDAGVLAAATVDTRQDDSSDADAEEDDEAREERIRREAALSMIEVNGFSDANVQPEFEMTDNSVIVRAEIEYSPMFGKLLGREKMTLSAVSESGLGSVAGVEIALVLDSTRSMEVDGKMAALKEGAIKLVDAIEESNSGSKIGLVPFARYVRLDDSFRTASWFEMPAEYDTTRTWQQATHTGGTCTTETRTRDVDGVEQEYETEICEGQTTTYEEQSRVEESRWVGCVGTRLPPYNESDDAYSHKIPGLLNVVPHERIPNRNTDRKTYCPAKIRALDDDYEVLRNNINNMWTTDETYLPIGLAWGQRVLSPGEPFDNTPAGGDASNRQVMVLMTDGLNTTEIKQDTESVEQLRSPPYIAYVDDDEVALNANAATARMCAASKLQGIEIYTIAFKVTDPTTQALLRACASSPNQALTADSNTSLVQKFEKIAESLEGEIRLMR